MDQGHDNSKYIFLQTRGGYPNLHMIPKMKKWDTYIKITNQRTVDCISAGGGPKLANHLQPPRQWRCRPGGEEAAGTVAGPWSLRLWHWKQKGNKEQKPPLSPSTVNMTRAVGR